MPSMRKRLKPLYEELSRRRISVEEVEQRKRHLRMKVRRGKRSGLIFVSISPSDHRAIKNTVSDAEHALRKPPPHG